MQSLGICRLSPDIESFVLPYREMAGGDHQIGWDYLAVPEIGDHNGQYIRFTITRNSHDHDPST